jgi:hypothetical protein
MIKNKRILEKLKEKTPEQPQMYNFLEDIFEIESEGKQYSTFYKESITKYIKEIEEEKEK